MVEHSPHSPSGGLIKLIWYLLYICTIEKGPETRRFSIVAKWWRNVKNVLQEKHSPILQTISEGLIKDEIDNSIKVDK